MITLLPRYIEPLVGKVTNTRRKAKSQKMAECKDVVDETSCVGVVLLDSQIGLMVEQTVENMRGIAGVCGVHLGIEGRVLVGDVGIEEHSLKSTEYSRQQKLNTSSMKARLQLEKLTRSICM
jgi:hypothetical protein